MSDQKRIRVVIVDDHPIVRDGLRRLLQAEHDIEVVGEGSDGSDVPGLLDNAKPDIVLLDLAMPKVSGLRVVQQMATNGSQAKVIILTAAVERAEMLRLIELGVRGVVMKDQATDVLLNSIRSVMAGEYWLGREGLGGLVDVLRTTGQPQQPASAARYGLTAREMEIVAEIVEGATNRDLAAKFSISENTVKHHLTNIFDKLGVSSRLELALFALHHQLTSK